MTHDATGAVLADLIAISRHGERVFRSSIRHTHSPELALTFALLADNCDEGARQLEALAVRLGAHPLAERRTALAVQRAGLALRRLFAKSDDLHLLREAKHVEAVALARYGNALEKPVAKAVQALVERQYKRVKLNRGCIRDLIILEETAEDLARESAITRTLNSPRTIPAPEQKSPKRSQCRAIFSERITSEQPCLPKMPI